MSISPFILGWGLVQVLQGTNLKDKTYLKNQETVVVKVNARSPEQGCDLLVGGLLAVDAVGRSIVLVCCA